jgi:hypothetical protein
MDMRKIAIKILKKMLELLGYKESIIAPSYYIDNCEVLPRIRLSCLISNHHPPDMVIARRMSDALIEEISKNITYIKSNSAEHPPWHPEARAVAYVDVYIRKSKEKLNN